jgi:hypothetical protein
MTSDHDYYVTSDHDYYVTSDHDYYGVGIYAHYIIRMEKIMLRATAYLVIVNGREEARR